jgi:hypothetical protein
MPNCASIQLIGHRSNNLDHYCPENAKSACKNPKATNWLNICTCGVAEWGTSLVLILSLLFPEILAKPSHTPPPPQINVRGDRSA